jgi:thiamine biosynthesis protein ThiC
MAYAQAQFTMQNDEAQFAELKTLGRVNANCLKHDVYDCRPGHVPHDTKENMELAN